MKYAELTKKTPEELAKLVQDTQVELMKHKAQAATGAAGKQSGMIGKLKKDIARMKMAQGGMKKQ